MSEEPAERWYAVRGVEKIASPALLIYWAPFEANLEKMIEVAGGVERLRPHVKTHKMRDVVLSQTAYGIRKYKTATLQETEAVAKVSPADVLVAYPLVGPNLQMYFNIVDYYQDHTFSTLATNREHLVMLERAAKRAGKFARIFFDLDVGMGRTGMPPDEQALELYVQAHESANLRLEGLHVYDGHIRDADPAARAAAVEAAMAPVLALKAEIESRGFKPPVLVCGGSPTFLIHAAHPDRELSPGTTAFWDAGYSEKFPDLPFQPAAVLLTRVLGKPGPNQVLLDLGYKAVSADPRGERMKFLDPALADARTVMHSEEHLVIETAAADDLVLGQELFALPTHVCPTVALYKEACLVEDGKARKFWPVSARDRVRPQ